MGPEIIWGLGIGYLAISTIIENLPGKFKVRRISKSGVLKQKIDLGEVEQLPLDEWLKFEENNDIVLNFYQTLEKNFSHCDLSAFYSNISSLKINSSDESFLLKLLSIVSGSITGGAYSSKYNKIHIGDNPLGRKYLKKDILAHELLHMASSRRDKDKSCSGFHIKGKNISIGEGLNEGYTELLNGRYFSDVRKSDSYYDLQMIAAGVESIIGQQNMEQAYFVNDLNGLVSELARYSSVDQAIELIVKIDDLLGRKYRSNPEKAVKAAAEIREDIANIKLNKLKKQKENGEISETEYMHSVFAQELYINGYITFRKKPENGDVENYFVADGPLMKYGYVDIQPDEFNKYANDYYEHFKNNGLSLKQPWRNKFGITSRKIMETKFREKRNNKSRDIDNKIGIKRTIDSELDELFDIKNASCETNTSKEKEQKLK